jgi:hypothetical protein
LDCTSRLIFIVFKSKFASAPTKRLATVKNIVSEAQENQIILCITLDLRILIYSLAKVLLKCFSGTYNEVVSALSNIQIFIYVILIINL